MALPLQCSSRLYVIIPVLTFRANYKVIETPTRLLSDTLIVCYTNEALPLDGRKCIAVPVLTTLVEIKQVVIVMEMHKRSIVIVHLAFPIVLFTIPFILYLFSLPDVSNGESLFLYVTCYLCLESKSLPANTQCFQVTSRYEYGDSTYFSAVLQ